MQVCVGALSRDLHYFILARLYGPLHHLICHSRHHLQISFLLVMCSFIKALI